jgi:hypothetical protein
VFFDDTQLEVQGKHFEGAAINYNPDHYDEGERVHGAVNFQRGESSWFHASDRQEGDPSAARVY